MKKKEFGSVAADIAGWLNGSGRGARVQQIRQPVPGLLQFELYVQSRPVYLTFAEAGGRRQLFLSRDRAGTGSVQTGLLPALRRHLRGAVLTGALAGREEAVLCVLFRRGSGDGELLLHRNGAALSGDGGRLLAGNAAVLQSVPIEGVAAGSTVPQDLLTESLLTDGKLQLEALRQELEEKLCRQHQRALARVERALGRAAEDLQRFAGWEQVQRSGELLKSQLWKVQRGMSEVLLEDYFNPEGGEVSVPLDPVKSPAANVELLFRRAAKYRRGADKAKARHQLLEQELATMRGSSILCGAQISWEQLCSMLQQEAEQRREMRRKASGEPVRQLWRSWPCDGATILVGRNARGNDAVTFREAAGNDLWFHCYNWPGSHVVLRRAGRNAEPSPRQIRAAALLALYYSKGAPHGREEVTYSPVKFVKKIPGGKPGQVTVAGGKRICVDLRDPLLTEFISGDPGSRGT